MNKILFFITLALLYIWISITFLITSQSRHISDKKPICCYELYSIRIPIILMIFSLYLSYFTFRYNQCKLLDSFDNNNTLKDYIYKKIC